MENQILKIIYDALEEINEDQINKVELNKSPDIELLGKGASLDSLGLINLIVKVEQSLEDDFDTELTLASEEAMAQQNSPFKTVGALAGYIETLLQEKANA